MSEIVPTGILESAFNEVNALTQKGRLLEDEVVREHRAAFQASRVYLKDLQVGKEVSEPDTDTLLSRLDQNTLKIFIHNCTHSVGALEICLNNRNYSEMVKMSEPLDSYSRSARALLREIETHPEMVRPGEEAIQQRIISALESIPGNIIVLKAAIGRLNHVLQQHGVGGDPPSGGRTP